MNEEEIRSQINDIIEGEIQNSINEYLESQGKTEGETEGEKESKSKGFDKGEGKLKVKVSQEEVNKLIKEYKKTRKYMKSNLFEASQLVDKNGNQL